MLALALAAHKPCSVAKCPWLKDPIVQANPYSKYGPQPLIISQGTGMTRIDYLDANRCLEARDALLRQYQEQHPGVLVSSLTVVCIPR